MTSAKLKSMELSQKQKSDIEDLAGIGYNFKKIAMYLDMAVFMIEAEFRNPDSEFRYHYDRGILLKEAERDKQLSEASKNGSVSALQELEKKLKNHKLDDLRYDILNGTK